MEKPLTEKTLQVVTEKTIRRIMPGIFKEMMPEILMEFHKQVVKPDMALMIAEHHEKVVKPDMVRTSSDAIHQVVMPVLNEILDEQKKLNIKMDDLGEMVGSTRKNHEKRLRVVESELGLEPRFRLSE